MISALSSSVSFSPIAAKRAFSASCSFADLVASVLKSFVHGADYQ
jgi:hypothetical protein